MTSTHPANIINYCLKCGSPNFKKQGERDFKCAECGFHFYVNASAAVAALIADPQGKLMLVTRNIDPDKGKLDLPGGFVDHYETAEEALGRELSEELGLKIEKLKYVASAPNEYVFSGYSVYTLDLAFMVIPKTIEGLIAMDDIQHYKFYSEEELDYNELPSPSIKKFVKDYFNNEYNT